MTPDLSTAVGDRSLTLWEIISVVSSIVIAEWMLASFAGMSKAIVAIPVVLAFAVIAFSQRLRHEGLRDLGFRFDNFLAATYLLVLPILLTAVVFLIIGRKFGTTLNLLRWHPSRNIFLQLFLGFGWGLLQQYVLQGFLNRRAASLMGAGWRSIVLVATIFGCLHLPNLWLAAITFVAGLIWATIYQRAPNLFALALSHSIMTWFMISTLPESLLRHLRVGFGYFA